MALSSSSDGSSLRGSTRKLAHPKSSVKIELKNHFRSKVYSSSSPITGELVITTRRNVRFDSIQILLIGLTKTVIDGVNAPHNVTHTFLKMPMPIPESAYPLPRVLEPGRTYTIPFNFVVPGQLTINACNHYIASDQLQDHHVRLPPTMGLWEKDDLSPQVARIEYSVKARVLAQPDLEDKRIIVMEASHPIRVLPASAEEPPLNITENDKLYQMSQSKTMRKNILSGKLGRLTVEAAEPGIVFLSPDGRSSSTTTVQVRVRFDPASADVPPPKIRVSGKLVAHTYYSASTISSFPNLGDWSKEFAFEKRGVYTSSTSLPSVAVRHDQAHAPWGRHLTAIARRDSGYSSDGAEAASDSESCGGSGGQRGQRMTESAARGASTKKGTPLYHATTVQIPVRLPVDKKAIIPTFHSCITSRVYVLQLAVTGVSGSASTTVMLSLPLQVAVELAPQAAPPAGDGLPSFEAAVEEAEADAFLRPRLMHVPDEQYTGTSTLPGYAASMAR